jgi:hypothetical protein
MCSIATKSIYLLLFFFRVFENVPPVNSKLVRHVCAHPIGRRPDPAHLFASRDAPATDRQTKLQSTPQQRIAHTAQQKRPTRFCLSQVFASSIVESGVIVTAAAAAAALCMTFLAGGFSAGRGGPSIVMPSESSVASMAAAFMNIE